MENIEKTRAFTAPFGNRERQLKTKIRVECDGKFEEAIALWDTGAMTMASS